MLGPIFSSCSSKALSNLQQDSNSSTLAAWKASSIYPICANERQLATFSGEFPHFAVTVRWCLESAADWSIGVSTRPLKLPSKLRRTAGVNANAGTGRSHPSHRMPYTLSFSISILSVVTVSSFRHAWSRVKWSESCFRCTDMVRSNLALGEMGSDLKGYFTASPRERGDYFSVPPMETDMKAMCWSPGSSQ